MKDDKICRPIKLTKEWKGRKNKKTVEKKGGGQLQTGGTLPGLGAHSITTGKGGGGAGQAGKSG